jgi:hypothetical protein
LVTEYPRAFSRLAKEAAIMPLPNDEATPPVTNMYLVEIIVLTFLFVCPDLLFLLIHKAIKRKKSSRTSCVPNANILFFFGFEQKKKRFTHKTSFI